VDGRGNKHTESNSRTKKSLIQKKTKRGEAKTIVQREKKGRAGFNWGGVAAQRGVKLPARCKIGSKKKSRTGETGHFIKLKKNEGKTSQQVFWMRVKKNKCARETGRREGSRWEGN